MTRAGPSVYQELNMITDHDHEYVMRGRWRTGWCTCGQRLSAHESWGRALADKLGGEPQDYTTEPSK